MLKSPLIVRTSFVGFGYKETTVVVKSSALKFCSTVNIKLHETGFAKSVEVWQDNKLVGGLYGVDLGKVFCGESMFSTVSNASKVAFVSLIQKLKEENYHLLDCQVHNDHLEKLGAFEISRAVYMKVLKG